MISMNTPPVNPSAPARSQAPSSATVAWSHLSDAVTNGALWKRPRPLVISTDAARHRPLPRFSDKYHLPVVPVPEGRESSLERASDDMADAQLSDITASFAAMSLDGPPEPVVAIVSVDIGAASGGSSTPTPTSTTSMTNIGTAGADSFKDVQASARTTRSSSGGLVEEPDFFDCERGAPLLMRNNGFLSAGKLPGELRSRLERWPVLCGACTQPASCNGDVGEPDDIPDEGALRIFRLDAERTFVSETHRTPMVECLKRVWPVNRSYHQGLGRSPVVHSCRALLCTHAQSLLSLHGCIYS